MRSTDILSDVISHLGMTVSIGEMDLVHMMMLPNLYEGPEHQHILEALMEKNYLVAEGNLQYYSL